MPSESLETQIARVDERLKQFMAMSEKTHETQQEIKVSIQSIQHRVGQVEATLANNAPTLDEFIEIKHKVVGAGLFGKWVWGFGGALIGIIAAARTEIFDWFAK